MLFHHAQHVPDSVSESGDGKLPASDVDVSHKNSLTKLVENLGFGLAQMRVLTFSSCAVFFCDGCELALLPLISTSTAATFGLGPYQEALMLTVALFGLMVGNMISGYIGDTLGRRPAILVSLGSTAMLGYASSLVMDYPSLIASRCLLGVGMGIGMTPSMVRISENCPEPYRVFCQGCRSMSSSCFGPLLVALVVGLDDPFLQELNWRRIMTIVATLPAFFCIAAFVLLSESPVWLACTGQHGAAQAGFAEVKQQNSAHSVEVQYEQRSISTREHLGTWEQFRIVFSADLWLMTCSLMSICFLGNVVSYGDYYALAQVLPDISLIPAAWQMSLRAGLSFFWVVLAVMLVNSMTRKHATILSVLAICGGSFLFLFGGAAQQPRSMLQETCFQSGTNMIAFAQQMLFVAVLQFAIEIYPPSTASTGSAVILATGRVGAMSAPMIFESLRYAGGSWTTFYIFSGSFAFVVAILFSFVPGIEPFRPGESDFGTFSECKGLEDGTKATTYGAASEALCAGSAR